MAYDSGKIDTASVRVVIKNSEKTGNEYGQLYVAFPNGYECSFLLNNDQRFILKSICKKVG